MFPHFPVFFYSSVVLMRMTFSIFVRDNGFQRIFSYCMWMCSECCITQCLGKGNYFTVYLFRRVRGTHRTDVSHPWRWCSCWRVRQGYTSSLQVLGWFVSLDSAFGVATNYVIANWPDKSHTVQPWDRGDWVVSIPVWAGYGESSLDITAGVLYLGEGWALWVYK